MSGAPRRPAPNAATANHLRRLILDVPDFPRRGVVFKDITPLLLDPAGLAECVRLLAERAARPEAVVAIESRGFVFGTALALHWGVPLVPARKFGKLPGETVRQVYSLEYGEDTIEIHRNALAKGQRVSVVDDLLATGGTANAVTRLVEQLGARVDSLLFVIELRGLGGRERLSPHRVEALIDYDVADEKP
jgi:adenine phosphoribosyltransferase